MNWEDYLSSIYHNPDHPAGYGGPIKIYHQVLKEGLYNIGLYRIKKWLQNQESYSLFRPRRRKFKRNRVIVNAINQMWDADLMDLPDLASENEGVKYILICIDVFSKYIYIRPLRTKSDIGICKQMDDILKVARPRSLRTDKGFLGHKFAQLMTKYGVHHYTTENETKANFVERAIRTIKNQIFRFLNDKQSKTYINHLQDFVKSYNSSYHSTIGLAPNEISLGNESAIFFTNFVSM